LTNVALSPDHFPAAKKDLLKGAKQVDASMTVHRNGAVIFQEKKTGFSLACQLPVTKIYYWDVHGT